jgi:hypothetical protein
MKKSIALVAAALFVTTNLAPVAFAADKADKKPTADECKKDPKMKGCEDMKKK